MKYVIWGLGLAVISGTPVSAQSVADAASVAQPEDALVVTANRTREKRENVASSMEVVTEAQLEERADGSGKRLSSAVWNPE